MPYAVNDDVLLRAGRVAGIFSVAGKRPNISDIDKLLADVSNEIDAEFRARGYDPALFDQSVKDALKDLAAYGALYRAVSAADPSGSVQNLRNVADTAREVWESAMGTPSAEGSIAKGTFSVVRQLEAGRGGGGPGTSAGSFFDEEPLYPTDSDFVEGRQQPLQAPEFARGQKL
jgi:hypothetical protein